MIGRPDQMSRGAMSDESLSLKAFADLTKRYHVANYNAGNVRDPLAGKHQVEAEGLYDALLDVAADALLKSPKRRETLIALDRLFISSDPAAQGGYGPGDQKFLGALCLRIAGRVKPTKEGIHGTE